MHPFRCVVKKVKEKRKKESTIINDNEDSVERVAKEMPLQIDEASFHINSRSLVPSKLSLDNDTHRVQCPRGDFCISEHKVSPPFFHRCCTHPSIARVSILSEDKNAKKKKEKERKEK